MTLPDLQLKAFAFLHNLLNIVNSYVKIQNNNLII